MIETNPELELAFEYISETKRHIFLTGKAGTGKTTFLNRVREEVPKRLAVVAPTGVAAINAKGVTIHSLFQLPFGLIAPEQLEKEIGKRRFSRKKIDLIKGLDLLVIDEISMVRADVLDAVDAVLRRFRQSGVPFGGLQLLMIGDLHQLPPVVRPEEWYQMQGHYTTPYFFGSIALRQATPTVIQLKHIYRQSDGAFIELLNKVRNNQIDQACLETLNQRYIPDFNPDEDEGYITLTSHNNAAQLINAEKLGQLSGRSHTLSAVVEGEFPESMYPNTEKIVLKVGAQVMFNKNDTYPDRMYYNGKIGVVTDIFGEHIKVECPGEEPIDVYPVTWENRKYELNAESKEIEDKVVGTYEQHPLKLAWAITIHKSQGLTFDNVIIDAQSAFAHGQVYVALSRCKTFEGIVLRTPIETSSVRTDNVVQDYSKNAEENQPTTDQLLADKRAYQADCLRELFNFSVIEKAARWFLRSLLEHEKAIQGDNHVAFKELLQQVEEKVFTIGNKFLPWLEIYFREGGLPTEHQKLNERLEGATAYFIPYLSTTLLPALQAFNAMTDNQSVRKQLDERMHNLRLLVFTKWKLFESLKDGFEPTAFIKAKANAEIDFERSKPAKKTKTNRMPKNIPNHELYAQLAQWRQDKAVEMNIPAYAIAANKTLLEVVKVLPTSGKSLADVGGFGKKRLADHGPAILEMVIAYVQKHQLSADLMMFASTAPAAPKAPKTDTKKQSLDLFKAGKSLAEIAEERGLKESTIRGHLVHWVGKGEVPVTTLVSQEYYDLIAPYLKSNPDQPLSEVFQHFEQKIGFDELRAVRSFLQWEDAKEEE